MLRVHWQGQPFNVTRLVLPRDHSSYSNTLRGLADRHGLPVSDDRTDPRPGDFWAGTYPERGWGNADPDLVGWASFIEVPLAVHQFEAATGRFQPNEIEEAGEFEAALTLQFA